MEQAHKSASRLQPANGDSATAPVSVVIIARNEEINIAECLESVGWAAEVIVVDSGSTDRTITIAHDCGATVHQTQWLGFGRTKQLAIELASQKWVLSLDADERVTPELRDEIVRSIARAECDGFKIPRLTNFVGHWVRHSGWYPDHVLRLFKRGQGGFTDTEVHEEVLLDGKIGVLNQPLLHYSYRSLSDYLTRLDRYTSLAAKEMYESGTRFSLWQILMKPPAIFFKRYLLKLGFLDGWTGLQIAVLSAMYVFVKYSKLWALQR